MTKRIKPEQFSTHTYIHICIQTFVTAMTEANTVMKLEMKATTGFHTKGIIKASRTA